MSQSDHPNMLRAVDKQNGKWELPDSIFFNTDHSFHLGKSLRIFTDGIKSRSHSPLEHLSQSFPTSVSIKIN